MKRLLAFVLMLCIGSTAFAQVTDDQEKDREEIKKVILTSYVEGLQNEGDQAKIDAGFHPGFRLLGIGQGSEMWELPIYTWKEQTARAVKEGKKPRKAGEEVSVKFLNIDITGTAAVSKIEFYVGEKLTFVDYISLYKFPDGWKIVGKIFYKFPEKS
jgi:hypothetical protein